MTEIILIYAEEEEEEEEVEEEEEEFRTVFYEVYLSSGRSALCVGVRPFMGPL